jgi:hypothetical protein
MNKQQEEHQALADERRLDFIVERLAELREEGTAYWAAGYKERDE